MRKITEVALPGVGVRQEFTSATGQTVTVVSHRGGRRDLALSARDDPDSCRTILELDGEDAATLASILGAPQVAASTAAMQRIEGLAIDWITVSGGSAVGTSIASGRYRTLTGASIVAVIRGEQTHAAPEPGFTLAPGDVAVSVGTTDGLAQLRALLAA